MLWSALLGSASLSLSTRNPSTCRSLSWRRCNSCDDSALAFELPPATNINLRVSGSTDRAGTHGHAHWNTQNARSVHTAQRHGKSAQRCVALQTTRWYIKSLQNSATLITLTGGIYTMITARVLAKSGSLVNELQSAQGDRIGPGRWPAGAASAPMPTSVHDTPANDRNSHNYSPPRRSF